MGLNSLLDQFFLLSTARDKKTQEHYRRAVRWFGELLGRPAQISDLTDDHIAALLSWLQQTRNQRPTTANGTHKCLCRLWRWARDKGKINTGPTVPKLQEPTRIPRAWSKAELMQIAAAASRMPGSIAGMPARLWWRAAIALLWDTACRSGELTRLRWEWMDWGRCSLHVPAEVRKKKKKDACYLLMPDTMEALAAIRQTQGPILGDIGDRSAYFRLWDDLLDMAGLPKGREYKAQMFRRSFATHLKIGGGDPTEALDHENSGTTKKSYIDPTLTAQPHGQKMPFRLIGGNE